MRNIKSLSLGLGLFAIAACSSIPEVKLGSALEKPSYRFRTDLPDKGQLFVAQALGAAAPPCYLLRNEMTVTMRRDGEATSEPLEISCTYLKGNLVVHTKGAVPKGKYVVDVSRATGIKGVTDRPRILVKYDDPEFNSGTDYLADGAKELDAGQTVKGAVSYAEGNATDWIRVKGNGGKVALTFLDSSNDKKLMAMVYQFPSNASTPRLVGVLPHKSRKLFPIREDNLLVKIQAKGFEGQGPYALIRGDSGAGAGAKGVKIGVIDCYQTGTSSAVVLLRKSENLKVNDQVTVFGKRSTGEVDTIGACQVTTIQGDQVSCKMDTGLKAQYVEYRAEAKVKG